MNIRKKGIIITTCLLLSLLIGISVQAQIDQDVWRESPKLNEIFWNGQQQEFSNSTGLGDFSPVTVVTNMINIAMGFIGITTVVMFMLAGFKILLSSGNEDTISQAKKMMWGTIVGTFLIMASFGIAKFFIGTVANATGLY
ncbi:hypothetical protein L6270_03505 [Candidatus Parcubacteria bacterium]|nr:hypothetical protein [Patescibacteria group bacterium]MBU4309030.1 hypothetical protein [Patescibacteria group bacterium]MBU4577391.1 hypothetical protein [Patescibacteria group bacterium]MCG2697079.1 hypothetical protein [Candidatus Parcubacteria bacterium]